MTQRREPCCELFWVGAAQNPMTWEHLHGPPPVAGLQPVVQRCSGCIIAVAVLLLSHVRETRTAYNERHVLYMLVSYPWLSGVARSGRSGGRDRDVNLFPRPCLHPAQNIHALSCPPRT
jgi:hypothetical protein